MAIDQFLPPSRSLNEVVACLGLVSDTHYPLRCETLPPTLFTILAGVDLLLHAGDVGELTVLDQLSTIAPIVAVHGNDETDEAQQTLPYQQVVAVKERRILLWHSHYPNREEELASRENDAMVPKFKRTIDRAHAAGATIAIFGHWHIPLIYEQDGVTVINPGAMASGNFFTRQLLQSVALLYLFQDGSHHVAHVDLTAPTAIFTPHQQWPTSFKATLIRYNESILAPPLAAAFQQIHSHFSAEKRQALTPVVLPFAQRCWRGEQDVITLEEFTEYLQADKSISPALRSELQTFVNSDP